MTKKTLIFFGLLVASVWTGFGQESSTQASFAQIEKLENEVAKAHRKSDPETLGRIYADDFEGIAGSGVATTKSTILAFYDGSKSSGDRVHETDQMAIRVFDKTAIVTARLEYRSGARDSETVWMRYTRVYVLRGGVWQIVAEQFTFLKDGAD